MNALTTRLGKRHRTVEEVSASGLIHRRLRQKDPRSRPVRGTERVQGQPELLTGRSKEKMFLPFFFFFNVEINVRGQCSPSVSPRNQPSRRTCRLISSLDTHRSDTSDRPQGRAPDRVGSLGVIYNLLIGLIKQ